MSKVVDQEFCRLCTHHEAISTRLDLVEGRVGLVEKFILGTLVFFATASVYTVGLVRDLPKETAQQIREAVKEIEQAKPVAVQPR